MDDEQATTWQDRLELEYQQLSERIRKLHEFFDTETFKNLGLCQQIVMENQYFAMQGYALCLQTRLNMVKNDPTKMTNWW